MRGWILSVLIPVLVVGAALYGLVALGKVLRDQVKDQARFVTLFADVVCQPPAGEERSAFLAEVQRLASLPDQLSVLDDDLPARLAEAFAHHPWVERVEEVTVLPSRRVEARLIYRVPVLAVPQTGAIRCVDGQGILLPADALADGLPIWRGPASTPHGTVGSSWGDSGLEAAARTLAALRPHRDRLAWRAVLTAGGEVVLTTPGGSRVLWGRPPGREPAGEASAALKMDRLLDYARRFGDLDRPDGVCEHDVRPAAKAIVQPLRRGG